MFKPPSPLTQKRDIILARFSRFYQVLPGFSMPIKEGRAKNVLKCVEISGNVFKSIVTTT